MDFGWFFVATPGDVDGDGVPDRYVGDPTDTGAGPGSGRAYVFSGREARALLRALLAHGRRADTNCDGRIDLRDYLTFLSAVLFGCE